ncbi:hypothetical protein [Actinacidiphila sp. ITFR-21]|jgi:hypothetical protein|uniref:hypothetical protein n=1 Tax=Actinacidiphila sp. ITFR-21 TaxID=3075199 RepID=UPI00288A71DA|nr:hypothetical protein [Streptomyces sp. ITFR-21]WNI14079.1 hypothetical protein RLT57_00075 [Streptomyces sp. ITFR-21]WNI19471.1 hypothetical protein RLT57_30615 [Streptomyces sp. ITFR-21]
MQWCDEQGANILGAGVDLENVMAGFIIPVEQTERPPYPLLGLEWPWQWRAGPSEGPPISYNGQSHPVADTGFRVDDFAPHGPLRFSLVSPPGRSAPSSPTAACLPPEPGRRGGIPAHHHSGRRVDQQAQAVSRLSAHQHFEDDDGPGEVADLVGITADEAHPRPTL